VRVIVFGATGNPPPTAWAMIVAARRGAPMHVLENQDINELAARDEAAT
jgi:hypothetical protein